MNSRRRSQTPGRSSAPQVQFCQRCGGIITSQQGAPSQNACRCSKEERARYRVDTPSPETGTEQESQATDGQGS